MAKDQRTPLQKKRYDLVLEAARHVIREHGYDDTRMQDVAARSGVALGTIYSYFGSRESLIFVATQTWVTATSKNSLPVDESLPIEGRMIRMVRDSARLLIVEPELLRAWARSHLSTDPLVIERVRADTLSNSLSMYPADLLPSSELARDMGIVMEHVWFTGMVRWSLGQKDFDDVYADVERAMLLVFNAHRLAKANRLDLSAT